MKRVLAGMVALGLSAWVSAAHAEKDRYDVGEAVPSFTLKAVNGEDVGDTYISIDRYYGQGAKDQKKAILMSFFATYCEPCKKEMPLLAALYKSYKDKGFQAIVISIDKEPEKIDFAKSLAKESGVTFPVLSDRFNIVAKRYFISKLPNVYLLDGEGKVISANVGYNDDISRKLVDDIRRSIGESTTEALPADVQKHMGKHGGSTGAVAVPVEGAVQAEATAADPASATPTATAAAETPAEDEGKGKGKKKGKVKGKKKGK